MVHQPGNNNDDDRDARVDQYGIDGSGRLHGKVDQGVETGDPEKSLEKEESAMLFDYIPLLVDQSQAKGGKNQQGRGPAPEGKADWWNFRMHSPA